MENMTIHDFNKQLQKLKRRPTSRHRTEKGMKQERGERRRQNTVTSIVRPTRRNRHLQNRSGNHECFQNCTPKQMCLYGIIYSDQYTTKLVLLELNIRLEEY